MAPIGVDRLDAVLKPISATGHSLSLVFISACFSASTAQARPATLHVETIQSQAFVSAGVKHVVAVHEKSSIEDKHARCYTQGFYSVRGLAGRRRAIDPASAATGSAQGQLCGSGLCLRCVYVAESHHTASP